MQKIKRIIATCLTATMIFTGLCACVQDSGDDPSGKTDDTTDAPSVPDTTSTEDSSSPSETTVAANESTAAVASSLTPKDISTHYRVLLIGNSFSFYNDLNKRTGIFFQIARKAGYNVTVDCVYKGAYTLKKFLDPNDEYGRQVYANLAANHYDIVVIQEQSNAPISNAGEFYDSCREFKKLIDDHGAELWLYATWGYKDGHADLGKYGRNTVDMEMKLRASTAAIAEELGIKVANVGAAFSKVYTEDPKLELYDTDKKHPGINGSYLAGYTLVGSIFGIDPATLTYNGDVSASYADILRAAASDIVLNGAPVSDGYAVSSVGIKAEVPQVDSSKTVLLKKQPDTAPISIITRDSAEVGDGWNVFKNDPTRSFSGIRGDKDKIASSECSAEPMTDAQKADIADIGYGVSVIGVTHMDADKKGTINQSTAAGVTNSVMNLVNGHWGSSYMAAMFFDTDRYNVGGEKTEGGAYTALITLNFGEKKDFTAIGYMSGSLKGFPQAQDVFVSDDGVNWTKVEGACYDAASTSLASVSNPELDPWNQNKPTVEVLFSMAGTAGKYIRIGIIRGGDVNGNTTGLDAINTRELVVF